MKLRSGEFFGRKNNLAPEFRIALRIGSIFRSLRSLLMLQLQLPLGADEVT